MRVMFRIRTEVMVRGAGGCWEVEVKEAEGLEGWYRLIAERKVKRIPEDGWSWPKTCSDLDRLKKGTELWVRVKEDHDAVRYEVGGDEDWVWEVVVRPYGLREIMVEQSHRRSGLVSSQHFITLANTADLQRLKRVSGLRLEEVRMWMALAVMGGL